MQGWVNGSLQNDGWMLKSDNLEGTRTSFLGFWSKDGAAATNAPGLTPTLIVTFTVPVPEPAILMLLGVGAPWLLAAARGFRHEKRSDGRAHDRFYQRAAARG